MIEVCSIASGSNGNCYYVGNENEAILIDAGISRRQILDRMKERKLNPQKIKAIIISHEHADHVKGAPVLSKILNVPVYMTYKTHEFTYKPNRPKDVQFFTPGIPFSIGNITIHPILKKHDAAEPCSFCIEVHHLKVGVFTDLGSSCDNVHQSIGECDFLFLESNYDEQMLWAGPYPYPLKKRVASDVGHLSNTQALDLINKSASHKLTHIVLSHLSGENNHADRALQRFESLHQKYTISVAPRYAADKVYLFEKK